jgi:hypothetical protein
MLEPPPGGLVGRSADLAEIDAFLKTSGQGFAALALEGEPGIGKTVLWAESVRRAESRGARVLLTRPTEPEAGLPLSGLGDLFDGVDDATFELLPAPQSGALRGALLRMSVGDRGTDERALYAGVLSTLRVLASDCHVLVARRHTVAGRLVGACSRFPNAAPSVRARRHPRYRPGLGPARRQFHRHRRRGSQARAAAGTSQRRGVARGDKEPHRHVAVPADGRANGPLVRRQSALRARDRRRASHGANPDHLSVPPSLAELINARLERLPARTLQALAVVAAASLAVVAAASHPMTLLVDNEALAPAVREGIVSLEHERVGFAHPLFASAVYGLLDPEARRAVHRLLADRLEQPEESARHAALAALGPDRATAARLDAAAAIAERRGTPAAAAALVDLALGSTPGTDLDERFERMLTGAGYWLAAGDLARAQELLNAALLEEPLRALRARALQPLGQLHGRRSSFGQAALAAT